MIHRPEACATRGFGTATTASRRRRVIILATAAACLLGADAWVRETKSSLDPFYIDRYRRKLAAIMAEPGEAQILLMGSSRARYALVPEEFRRITGLRAFNFGVPASKPIEWQWMARNGIRTARPRLVVLGVNASAIRADYLPVPAARNLFTLKDFLSYCRTDGWSGELASHYLDRNVLSVWALLHRRFEVKMLVQKQLGGILPKYAQQAIEREAMASKPCPPDGFEHPWLAGRRLKNLGLWIEDDPKSITAANPPPFSEQAPALSHFEKLLEWCIEQRVPLVVAYLPNSPATEDRWRDVEPQMQAAIASACRAHGIPFLPCDQRTIPRTDYDYIEEMHTGLPLARRISRRIARFIRARGLLDASSEKLASLPEEETNAP
ncbi:MAG: hypothetical protein ACE5E1_09255 [Phycisphaerae bacterium]